MIEELKHIKCEKSDLRKFGLMIGTVLLIIAGLLFWKEKQLFKLPVTIGILLFASSLAVPIILKPVYWPWMVFATILGWIMTRLVLSSVFFLAITPIGLVSRLFGKQFLKQQWDASMSTYWTERTDKDAERSSYESQF